HRKVDVTLRVRRDLDRRRIELLEHRIINVLGDLLRRHPVVVTDLDALLVERPVHEIPLAVLILRPLPLMPILVLPQLDIGESRPIQRITRNSPPPWGVAIDRGVLAVTVLGVPRVLHRLAPSVAVSEVRIVTDRSGSNLDLRPETILIGRRGTAGPLTSPSR